MSIEKEKPKNILKRVLAARLVVFAATIIWVMGWLTLGLALYPILFDSARGLVVWQVHPTTSTILSIWFVITFVVVGIYVGYRGFRFVGRWVKE